MILAIHKVFQRWCSHRGLRGLTNFVLAGAGGRWAWMLAGRRGWPVAGGRWPVAGGRGCWLVVVAGRWPVAGGRWPVAGGRGCPRLGVLHGYWRVAGGRWPVASGQRATQAAGGWRAVAGWVVLRKCSHKNRTWQCVRNRSPVCKSACSCTVPPFVQLRWCLCGCGYVGQDSLDHLVAFDHLLKSIDYVRAIIWVVWFRQHIACFAHAPCKYMKQFSHFPCLGLPSWKALVL